MMFNFDSSKVQPEILSWLDNYTPDPSTLKWSTLGQGDKAPSGCFYRSPIRIWMKNQILLPADKLHLFAMRIKSDLEDRGITDAAIMDPKFDPLKTTASGKNLWDPMHFGLLELLDSLHELGHEWAFLYATRLLQSYYLNAKYPYLRTGGYVLQPYGTQGRLRVAGWILHAMAAWIRMAKRANVLGVQLGIAVSSLVQTHLSTIQKAFPLTANADGVNGDHLNVPHLEVFQIGIILSGIDKLKDIGFNTNALGSKFGSLITAASVNFDTMSYVYDLRVNSDGMPLPYESGDKIVSGVSSVNAWLCYPEDIYTMADIARSAEHLAIEAGWKEKQPSLYAVFFMTPKVWQ